MRVTKEGSVRVDLVGGTLDLEPINLILPNVVTLNVATGLKAKVVLEQTEANGVEVVSSDYDKTYFFTPEDFEPEKLYAPNSLGEMTFIAHILDLFEVRSGLRVGLSSGAPPGSGLGGSSAMGVTLYSALCEYFKRPVDIYQAVATVKGAEGRILNQGVPGYQDYFPALTGGVLCIRGVPGRLEYEQLYTPELKEFLESRLTLVYSGISRNSGINNWEVYKAFFDQDKDIRRGMETIARISFEAYQSVKKGDFERLIELIGLEGESRKQLAKEIVPQEVEELRTRLADRFGPLGLKICGAGGGGCFILTHSAEHQGALREAVAEHGMRVLDFYVDAPIQ